MTTWSIICDFDGTITTQDLGVALLKEFGDPDVRQASMELFLKDKISIYELQNSNWPTVKATEHDMRHFMDVHAKIRPGFKDFFNFCAQQRVDFNVVSGGFDLYINYLIELFELSIQPKMNHGQLSLQGTTVDFPYRSKACDYCSNCKGEHARQYRSQGGKNLKLIGIGDGASDYCLVKEVDFVFACGNLIDHCIENCIDHEPFDDFEAVQQRLQSIIQTSS